MSISNRQLLAAVLSLLKAGQLNETVLTMAMERPSLLVARKPKINEFSIAQSAQKVYIDSKWFPMIRKQLENGNRINAIRIIRFVGGYTQNSFMPYDPNIQVDSYGIPSFPAGKIAVVGLADAKYVSETGNFS